MTENDIIKSGFNDVKEDILSLKKIIEKNKQNSVSLEKFENLKDKLNDLDKTITPNNFKLIDLNNELRKVNIFKNKFIENYKTIKKDLESLKDKINTNSDKLKNITKISDEVVNVEDKVKETLDSFKEKINKNLDSFQNKFTEELNNFNTKYNELEETLEKLEDKEENPLVEEVDSLKKRLKILEDYISSKPKPRRKKENWVKEKFDKAVDTLAEME